MFHTVVSIEAGTSTEWQAALLAYSFARAGQPGPLTILCAGGAPSEPIVEPAEVLVTPNYRRLDGGDYAPLNKPGGLDFWMRRGGPRSASVLLLDPDCVFLRAALDLPEPASGAPWGQPFPSDIDSVLRESVVRNLTRHPELLQPVGIPLLIDSSDLAAVAPLWTEQTLRLRRFGVTHFSWVAEMIGYQLAAADLGWWHQRWQVDCGPALLHYYRGNCGLSWTKAGYRPWDPVPLAPRASSVARGLGELLNEYADLRRSGWPP